MYLFHSLCQNLLLFFFFFLVFIWVIWFHCWEKQDLLKAEWTNTMLNSLYMQQMHALIHHEMSLLPICTIPNEFYKAMPNENRTVLNEGKVECD
jgi:hypothetical protein